MGVKIPATVLFVAIVSLGSNVLAADFGGSNVTQAPRYDSKSAYSLLPDEDASAFELVALTEAKTAAEVPPEEKDTTERLFSVGFPKLLLRDTWYALSSPVRWDAQDWLKVGVGIAAISAVALADTSVKTQVQHIQNASANNAASQIRRFGSYYSFATLGLFYVGGEIFHDPPAKAVFIDGAAASLITTGIVAPALKYMVGRARPSANQGNHYFQPFSSTSVSFPSGETTQAFAVASVIAAHYDPLWIKVSSYGIASLVGMARIYAEGHWTSDTLAGALIGATVGTAIVRYNEKRRKTNKDTGVFITPLLTPGAGGIAITLVR